MTIYCYHVVSVLHGYASFGKFTLCHGVNQLRFEFVKLSFYFNSFLEVYDLTVFLYLLKHYKGIDQDVSLLRHKNVLQHEKGA